MAANSVAPPRDLLGNVNVAFIPQNSSTGVFNQQLNNIHGNKRRFL